MTTKRVDCRTYAERRNYKLEYNRNYYRQNREIIRIYNKEPVKLLQQRLGRKLEWWELEYCIE